MAYAIVGVSLVAAFCWKLSKGPTWKGWSAELFGEDEE